MGDDPAVLFELLLARAPDADPALVARQVGPHPLQPGHRVLELRQLDLEVGLVGPRPGGEDVEDDLGPVDHLDAQELLQVPRLGGAEVVVEDDEVGLVRLDQLLQLLDLARADVRGDVRLLPLLEHAADDDQPGGLGQAPDLVQGVVGVTSLSGRITPTRTDFSRRSRRSVLLSSPNGDMTSWEMNGERVCGPARRILGPPARPRQRPSRGRPSTGHATASSMFVRRGRPGSRNSDRNRRRSSFRPRPAPASGATRPGRRRRPRRRPRAGRRGRAGRPRRRRRARRRRPSGRAAMSATCSAVIETAGSCATASAGGAEQAGDRLGREGRTGRPRRPA